MSESQLSAAQRSVDEGTTHDYSAVLVDEQAIPRGSDVIGTLTLTLLNDSDQSVINSRNAQNVLNTNGVTLDTQGHLVWTIAPADTAIIDPDGVPYFTDEIHIAQFDWTWSAGAKHGRHVVRLLVRRLKPAA